MVSTLYPNFFLGQQNHPQNLSTYPPKKKIKSHARAWPNFLPFFVGSRPLQPLTSGHLNTFNIFLKKGSRYRRIAKVHNKKSRKNSHTYNLKNGGPLWNFSPEIPKVGEKTLNISGWFTQPLDGRWCGNPRGEEVGAHLDVLVHMFHHIFHLVEGGEPRQVFNKQVTPVSPGVFRWVLTWSLFLCFRNIPFWVAPPNVYCLIKRLIATSVVSNYILWISFSSW